MKSKNCSQIGFEREEKCEIHSKKREKYCPCSNYDFIDETLQSTEVEVISLFVKLSAVRKFYFKSLDKLDSFFVTVNATQLKESYA